MSWLAWAILSIAFWGTWGAISKVALARARWTRVVLVYYVGSLAILTIVMLARSSGADWPDRGILYGLLTGAAGVVGLVSLYRALDLAKASVIIPLTGMFPIVTAILSLIFLDESVSALQAVGIACAGIAVLLISRGD